MISATMFLVGIGLEILVYQSLGPLVVNALFILVGLSILRLTGMTGRSERAAYMALFTMGVLASAVAGFYADYIGDPMQTAGDAYGFYTLSVENVSDQTLDELSSMHAGALAIIIWRPVYDFFLALGFEGHRYIGVSVNCLMVAMVGPFTVRLGRSVCPEASTGQEEQLTKIMPLCALYWLYASVHLRDAHILLSSTLLIYMWSIYLRNPRKLVYFALPFIGTIIGAIYLDYLRMRLGFLAIVIACAALFSLAYMRTNGPKISGLKFILAGAASIAILGLAMTFGAGVSDAVIQGAESYSTATASNAAGNNSLATSLILDQSPIVRAVLGVLYLFLFPIPVWSGLDQHTVYHLFKACNAIFFYFLIPALIVSAREILTKKQCRNPITVFLLLYSLGYSMAVALTSLETRHFGIVLPALFALVMVPNWRLRKVRSLYHSYLAAVLTGVSAIHLLWGLVKI